MMVAVGVVPLAKCQAHRGSNPVSHACSHKIFFIAVFACLGFLSPANRGYLMTCAMVLYVCFGFPAGFVSARLYKSFGGERWKLNVLLTSTLCSG